MLKNMAARMEASLETEITSPQVSHPFYNHPKVHEMRSYGFGNEEQIKQALLVYLDLLEAKRWWNVNAIPCSGLRQILVCGHPGQQEPLEVVLPVRQDNELSVCDLQNLLTKVKHEQDCNSLTLALMDTDSSIVYYKITDGFIPPDPPQSIQEKKKQRQRKFQHRKARFVELSRNADNVRERYFSLDGGCSGVSSNPTSGITVTADQNQNDAVVVSLGDNSAKDDSMENVFATGSTEDCRETTTKRPLDASTENENQGSKHRKIDEGQSSTHVDNSAMLQHQPSPSGSAYHQHHEPQPSPSYGVSPNSANAHPVRSRLYDTVPPHDSPEKEDEGVQVAVAMVQAPIIENDSDHDSGMDAGEDEDEGFDEEL